MDVYVLLDVLLVILIALFIPIGFWRGAYREAFVTLGVLFGASLGRFWGEPWGAELSQVTRLHESGGAFMIVMLCLIGATFLLGYSAGAAIPVPDPGWVARTLGALIAGANGALLLSFALGDIREYLLTSDETGFLDNAVVAPFLSDGTGWILLVGAAVFVPIVLVLALFGPDIDDEYYEDEYDYDYEYYEQGYQDPYPQRTMQFERGGPPFGPPQQHHQPPPSPAPAEQTRPVPTPTQQPARNQPESTEAHTRPAPVSQSAETQRQSSDAVEETQPHRPQRDEHDYPAPESTPDPPTATDTEPETESTAEDLPVGPVLEPQSPPESPFGAAAGEKSTDEQEVVFGHQPAASAAPGSSDDPALRRCPNCQADISQADGYCPRCGERI